MASTDSLQHITPGPWPEDGQMRGKGTIFVVPAVQDGGVFEWVANRRLIKSAPELLAALEVATNWLDEIGDFEDGEAESPEETSAFALAQFHALIARAKGGAV